MRDADNKVQFGEWLPDLPPLDNPGLTEARNVIPTDGTYKPYLTLSGVGSALAARPQGATPAVDSTGAGFFYAGTATDLYVRAGSGWTDKSTTVAYTTATTNYWRFAQFDTTIVATNYNDVPQRLTVGAGGNFANLAVTGTAPNARQVGIVGRFVVLGDTNDGTNGAVPSRLQWSAIDDETNWPTPGSANALSVQSGEQFMNANYGPVTSIANGEQYGIVLQRAGITRMTYIGGNVVFQFDTIERNRGAYFPNATVQIGRLVFFVAGDGFYVTDGVEVVPIGSRKVDNYFADTVDTNYRERMYGAIDFANKVIYWGYPGPSNSSGRPNRILLYNYEEKRWARAEDEHEVLTTGVTTAISLDDLDAFFASIDIVTPSLDASNWAGGNNTTLAFNSSYSLGGFSGSAGTALIDGQEIELNPGARTLIQGVKPLVTGAPTTTVALGIRDALSSAVSYSSNVTPTARTGFADFRSNARYARCRLNLTGAFDSAQGIEYQAQRDGAA